VVVHHNGKLVREKVGKNRREADRLRDKRSVEVDESAYTPPRRVRFSEWADQWREFPLATAARDTQPLTGDDSACRQGGIDVIVHAATTLAPARTLALVHPYAFDLEESHQPDDDRAVDAAGDARPGSKHERSQSPANRGHAISNLRAVRRALQVLGLLTRVV
jgi:hypothetical protein